MLQPFFSNNQNPGRWNTNPKGEFEIEVKPGTYDIKN
jgi:hypothetical protein